MSVGRPAIWVVNRPTPIRELRDHQLGHKFLLKPQRQRLGIQEAHVGFPDKDVWQVHEAPPGMRESGRELEEEGVHEEDPLIV